MLFLLYIAWTRSQRIEHIDMHGLCHEYTCCWFGYTGTQLVEWTLTKSIWIIIIIIVIITIIIIIIIITITIIIAIIIISIIIIIIIIIIITICDFITPTLGVSCETNWLLPHFDDDGILHVTASCGCGDALMWQICYVSIVCVLFRPCRNVPGMSTRMCIIHNYT